VAEVKVTHYENGYGYRVTVDGQEIPDLGDFSLEFPVDAVAECHLKVLVSRPVEIVTLNDAKVNIHFHIAEGHTLIETTTRDTPGATQTFKVTPV
jgi:hypothetical protein